MDGTCDDYVKGKKKQTQKDKHLTFVFLSNVEARFKEQIFQ